MMRSWAPVLICLFSVLLLFPGCGAKPDQPVEPTPMATPEPQPVQETPPESENRSFVSVKDFFAIAFVVEGGLTPSLKKALPEDQPYSENLAAQMTKALMWDLNPNSELRKGDRAKLMYKETRDRFKVRLYGIEYESKFLEKTLKYFFFWEKQARFPEYYTEAGESVAKRMKNCPLREYDEIVSLFKKGSSRNRGVKFRVSTGTKVYMPYSAVVERINWDIKKDGLGVEVSYPGTGLTAQFIHLSAIAGQVAPGADISVGDLFARTGVSGKTSIPHLEYRLLERTDKGLLPIDPFAFHKFETHVIGVSDYKNFVSVKHQTMALMRKADYTAPDSSKITD